MPVARRGHIRFTRRCAGHARRIKLDWPFGLDGHPRPPLPMTSFGRRMVLGAGVLAMAIAASAGIYGRIRAAQGGDDADADAPAGPPPVTSGSVSFSTDVAIPVKGVPAVRGALVV